MTETTPPWTGTLTKGIEPGTVMGELRDQWGWVVKLHGTLSFTGGYVLTGTLGEPPEGLRVPAIDGEGG